MLQFFFFRRRRGWRQAALTQADSSRARQPHDGVQSLPGRHPITPNHRTHGKCSWIRSCSTQRARARAAFRLVGGVCTTAAWLLCHTQLGPCSLSRRRKGVKRFLASAPLWGTGTAPAKHPPHPHAVPLSARRAARKPHHHVVTVCVCSCGRHPRGKGRCLWLSKRMCGEGQGGCICPSSHRERRNQPSVGFRLCRVRPDTHATHMAPRPDAAQLPLGVTDTADLHACDQGVPPARTH